MNKILTSIIAAVMLAVTVKAENVGMGVGSPAGFTVIVPGGITGTTTGIFNISTATKFAIGVTSTSNVANTSNTTVTVQRTMDGVNWLALSTISIANAGSTTVACISNYTGQADAQLRIFVDSGALAAVTNQTKVLINQLKY